MKFDAFSAGIEPGGLRNRNQIRILICYLLASLNVPLPKKDIVAIFQENGLANYFEVTNALADLTANGTVLLKDGMCTAGSSAKVIAGQLDSAVPPAVRERTVSAALSLLSRMKRESENKVEITETDRGCQVTCHISGGDMDLMSFSLYVPDRRQANLVKRNFQDRPDSIYQVLLALITGNRDLISDILKEMSGK
jgi:hypothetical protein